MCSGESGLRGQLAAIFLVLVNTVAFSLMAADKRKAVRRRRRRVRERTLLMLCICGGGPGTWIAMTAFRHKTKHASFRIMAPLFTVIWAVLLLWLLDTGWLG
jgi:uncharacterized membrane protein YsdA (DUF1294 family)